MMTQSFLKMQRNALECHKSDLKWDTQVTFPSFDEKNNTLSNQIVLNLSKIYKCGGIGAENGPIIFLIQMSWELIHIKSDMWRPLAVLLLRIKILDKVELQLKPIERHWTSVRAWTQWIWLFVVRTALPACSIQGALCVQAQVICWNIKLMAEIILCKNHLRILAWLVTFLTAAACLDPLRPFK